MNPGIDSVLAGRLRREITHVSPSLGARLGKIDFTTCVGPKLDFVFRLEFDADPRPVVIRLVLPIRCSVDDVVLAFVAEALGMPAPNHDARASEMSLSSSSL